MNIFYSLKSKDSKNNHALTNLINTSLIAEYLQMKSFNKNELITIIALVAITNLQATIIALTKTPDTTNQITQQHHKKPSLDNSSKNKPSNRRISNTQKRSR